MNYAVLVLNASYEVIHVCNLKRAITLIFKGVAIVEEETDMVLRSPTISIPVPAVIRLLRYVKIPYHRVKFSRKNVLIRDNYICQYCYQKFKIMDLTLDHVIPLSRGGWDGWDNVVTACRSCNNRKGDDTPEEAGMKLLRKPRLPSVVTYLQIIRRLGEEKKEWRRYLFFDQEEENSLERQQEKYLISST
ncbi:MAG TPA: HNH endonuclease [Candidatus Limnocylindrales bacterium]|nr:HNH endonuclease [Candidatus Limnocylindrales bacterium]